MINFRIKRIKINHDFKNYVERNRYISIYTTFLYFFIISSNCVYKPDFTTLAYIGVC